ncbi:MAG: FG-GAP-like repeat-containing protein [Planctomycetes bacterium]|nr:FG-GAP-like repeat-containing protein [Planctomycetota bacterium]
MHHPRRQTFGSCTALLAAGLVVFSANVAAAQATPANTNVDMLVVYTPGAAKLYASGISTRIQHVLTVANAAFADSEVGITLRLAGTQQLVYSDTVNTQTALSAIQKKLAPFGSIETTRTQLGADMVVLMRPYCGDGIAGLAYVGGVGTQGNLSGYKPWMYSHVAINTSDYVLAHELGHNFGLVHSRKQDPAGGTYHYSAGFGVQGVMTDVMAYPTAFGTGYDTKVYRFSNPNHTVNGYTFGVASSNTSSGADAAASLNLVRDTVAGFNTSKQFVASRVGEFGGDGKSDLFRHDPDDGKTYAWITGVSSAPTDGLGDELALEAEPTEILVAAGDFDGDGATDVLLRSDAKANVACLLGGNAPQRVDYPVLAGAYWQAAGSGDFDGDGDDDLVWRNAFDGSNVVWWLDGANAPVAQNLAKFAGVKVKLDALGDFDGDGKCDLFWRDYATGNQFVWSMNATGVKSTSATTKLADLAWRTAGAGDFDGDGDDDLVFHHGTTGALTLWYMNGASVSSTAAVQATQLPAWRTLGIGDFDGDGRRDDIVWNHPANEEDVVWTMNGAVPTAQLSLKTGKNLLEQVQAVADFDGDGKQDLVWRDPGTGANALWLMDGATADEQATDALVSSTQRIVKTGDFDGDGKQDLLWRDTSSGLVKIWLMNGATVTAKHDVTTVADAKNQIVGVGDLDGDGKDDVVLRHAATGVNTLWKMNGGAIASTAPLTKLADLAWKLAGVADLDGNGKDDLIWRHGTNGGNVVWRMNGTAVTASAWLTPLTDLQWKLAAVSDFDGNGKLDLLWRHSVNGKNTIWFLNGTTLASSAATTALTDTAWAVDGAGDFDGDGKGDVLWRHAATQARTLWLMNGATPSATPTIY